MSSLEQHGERYVIGEPAGRLFACARRGAWIAPRPTSPTHGQQIAERGGRRLWRAKVRAAHEKATHSVVSSERLEPAALEARWLATIPGLSFASVAGIIAHTGPIARYRHGRQLTRLAGTNPTRNETGERRGGSQAMSHRGRAGLRQVAYMDGGPSPASPTTCACAPMTTAS